VHTNAESRIHMRTRIDAVRRELANGALSPEPGKEALHQTRRAVVQGCGWRSLTCSADRDIQSLRHAPGDTRRLWRRFAQRRSRSGTYLRILKRIPQKESVKTR